MATPSEKSPEMARLLNNMGSALFGRTRTEALELGLCIVCGAPAKDFIDERASREYTISGSCQTCQDMVF